MTEEAAGEETFISHLVELRDRLVKASIGIAIACAALFIWPGPSHVYDLLAAPMVSWPVCVRKAFRQASWLLLYW